MYGHTFLVSHSNILYGHTIRMDTQHMDGHSYILHGHMAHVWTLFFIFCMDIEHYVWTF